MPQYQTTPDGRRVTPGDADYKWDQGSTSFDPLSGAKAFLADPARSQAPQPTAEDEQYAMDATSTPDQGMSLRGLTDIMESASLPVGMMGMIPSPMSPMLLGSSAVLSGAGGLRKLLNPDEDESRVGGGIQTGLSALPAMGGLMRGMKGLGGTAMKRFPISDEIPYRMGRPGQLSGLNDVQPGLGQIDDMIAETAVPRVKAAATEGLPDSWKQFAQPDEWKPTFPSRAPAIKRTEAGNQSRIARMNQQSESGARQVPYSDPNRAWPKELPDGGMGTLADDALLAGQAPSVSNDMLEAGGAWGDDLLAQMSERAARLQIPGRARAYHANTPFPE